MVSIAAPLAANTIAAGPATTLAGALAPGGAGLTLPGQTGRFAAFLDQAEPAPNGMPGLADAPGLPDAPAIAPTATMASSPALPAPVLSATATMLPVTGKILPASGNAASAAPVAMPQGLSATALQQATPAPGEPPADKPALSSLVQPGSMAVRVRNRIDGNPAEPPAANSVPEKLANLAPDARLQPFVARSFAPRSGTAAKENASADSLATDCTPSDDTPAPDGAQPPAPLPVVVAEVVVATVALPVSTDQTSKAPVQQPTRGAGALPAARTAPVRVAATMVAVQPVPPMTTPVLPAGALPLAQDDAVPALPAAIPLSLGRQPDSRGGEPAPAIPALAPAAAPALAPIQQVLAARQPQASGTAIDAPAQTAAPATPATPALADRAGEPPAPLPTQPAPATAATLAAMVPGIAQVAGDSVPAATATTAVPGTQKAALVDAVARARQDGAGAAVSATLAHGAFGRVDLEIRHRDDGLTVTMASADPGFAPAVLAASRADAGNPANQNGGQQASANSNTGTGNAGPGGGNSSQAQGHGTNQGGDGRPTPRAPATAQDAASARRQAAGGDDPDTAQGGVFA